MAAATITSKGQITLPKAVRERLRVGTGDQVDFTLNDRGEIVVRPIGSDVRDLRGFLRRTRRHPISVEAMNAAIQREHSRKR